MTGVVTVGEAMGSLASPRLAPLRFAGKLDLSFCGSEATVAMAVRRLGHPAAWVSRLGDDEVGSLIRGRMLGEGVSVYAALDDAPTGLILKETPRAGVRRARYYRAGSAASRMTPADVPTGLVESAAVVHLTGITVALSHSCRETVEWMVDRAVTASTRVSFDVNFRSALWSAADARAALLPMLGSVDVLFASREEAELLLDRDGLDSDSLARALVDLGPAAVIVTDGAQGSWWAVAEDSGQQPAFPAVEVDPYGAGDAYVGGFIAAELDGAEVAGAVEFASRVAALAVGSVGDWEGLPDRAEVAASIGPAGTIAR
jgi:2-dehydro-3-deoxygluconokinase